MTKIAIIGTGWGARVQVPAFRQAGLDVAALVGSQKEKTERIAADLNVAHASDQWRNVIAQEEISVVSIVTPPPLHAEISIAALEAGKHVLCEKPTALNAGEARRMWDVAKAHPEQFALIDHELRFHPALIELKHLLAEGHIGEVRYVRGLITNASRTDPTRAWSWWNDKSQGGGVLGAIGSHQTDILRYALGAEVKTVSAMLNTFVTERPGEEGLKSVTADDYYNLRFSLSNGVLATLDTYITAQSQEHDQITFYGTQGALCWQGGKVLHAASGARFEDITPPHSVTIPAGIQGAFPEGTVYLGHALKAYLGGDRSALKVGATFVDGFRIQAVLDAARESNRQGGATIQVASD